MGFFKKIFSWGEEPEGWSKDIDEPQDTIIGNEPETDVIKLSQEEILEKIREEIKFMSDVDKLTLINQIASDYFNNGGSDFRVTLYDELLNEAAQVIVMCQQGSLSLIQRKFKLGYNRAGKIMDQLEEIGVVGPFEGSKAREVYIKNPDDLGGLLSLAKQQYNMRFLNVFYQEYRDEIDHAKFLIQELKQKEEDRSEREKIKQQILERERKKRIEREALQELIDDGKVFNEFLNKEGKREIIQQDVMDAVWNRDGGRCVKCGSQENLEFDHIIPFSKGGATSYRNLQLLCKNCNLQKSNKLGRFR